MRSTANYLPADERRVARVETAAASATSPLASLERVFMAHIEFVVAHPGVPRIIFSQLQPAEQTVAKRMVQAMLLRYGQRMSELLTDGQSCDEVDRHIDVDAAATLFIGTIQGLVMQSLMHGDVQRIRIDAPCVFRIYRRGIERAR